MQPKPKSLTTAADDLLDIVKREGEISFSDASKKLSVSLQTIEAWATFLEEDGVLSIKYKMTTPYLTMPLPRKASVQKKSTDAMFQEKLADAEMKSEVENVSDLLSSAESKREEGEFGALDSAYGQILFKLKKVTQFLSSLVNISPQDKAEMLEKFSEAERRAKNASELVKENRFDDASREYAEIQSELTALVKKAKSDYSDVEEIKISGEAGLKKILDKTYELLEKGKLEEAISNYEQSKKILANLAQQWMSEKSSMQENIIKLNRDIVIYSNKIKQQRMRDGIAKINSLVSASRESLQKRKFATSAAYYGEIKKVFDGLPAGFAREKRRLKGEILKVFGQLIDEKEKRLKYRFDVLSKEAERLLKDAEKQLETGDVDGSFRTYKLLSKTYNQLPHGFLKKKFELQSRIARLYDHLSMILERKAESKLSAEGSQVLRLLEAMKRQIDSGKFSDANFTYSEINKVFRKLPDGFVQQKTELQKRIVELYEKLLESIDAKKSVAFKSSTEEIDRLMNACHDSLKKGDYANANSLYKKLKEAYSKLTPLDVTRRQQIRNKILALYRNIILGEKSAQADYHQKNKPLQPPIAAIEKTAGDIHQRIEALKSRSKAQVRMPA